MRQSSKTGRYGKAKNALFWYAKPQTENTFNRVVLLTVVPPFFPYYHVTEMVQKHVGDCVDQFPDFGRESDQTDGYHSLQVYNIPRLSTMENHDSTTMRGGETLFLNAIYV